MLHVVKLHDWQSIIFDFRFRPPNINIIEIGDRGIALVVRALAYHMIGMKTQCVSILFCFYFRSWEIWCLDKNFGIWFKKSHGIWLLSLRKMLIRKYWICKGKIIFEIRGRSQTTGTYFDHLPTYRGHLVHYLPLVHVDIEKPDHLCAICT